MYFWRLILSNLYRVLFMVNKMCKIGLDSLKQAIGYFLYTISLWYE